MQCTLCCLEGLHCAVLCRRGAVNPGGGMSFKPPLLSSRVGLSGSTLLEHSFSEARKILGGVLIVFTKFLNQNPFGFNIVQSWTQQNLKLESNLKMSFYGQEQCCP